MSQNSPVEAYLLGQIASLSHERATALAEADELRGQVQELSKQLADLTPAPDDESGKEGPGE